VSSLPLLFSLQPIKEAVVLDILGITCMWPSSLFFVFSSAYSCDVSAHSAHLCGNPCKLLGRRGCLGECTKVGHTTVFQHDPTQLQVTLHAEDEHMCTTCSALVHLCGQVRFNSTVAEMFLLWSLCLFSRAPSKTYNYLAGRRSFVRKAVVFLGKFSSAPLSLGLY
jgi:hypothetical protein